MIRRFRLTSSTDFKRVRQAGRAYAHPFLVLIVLPNDQQRLRFAVSAGRSVGKAVERNRAKRRVREALRPLIAAIPDGWDVVILARHPITRATFTDIQAALSSLLHRAHLVRPPHVP